jgi:hypothetical protein
VNLTILKPTGLVKGSGSYTYYEVVQRYFPDHGSVFGSYITIEGAGFAAGDESYMCILTPTKADPILELRSEFTAPPHFSPDVIQCIIPAWEYAAQVMNVNVIHNGITVTIVGQLSVFNLLSAWTAATLPAVTNFQGGMLITIHGKGFNPALPSGYTCQFLDSTSALCDAEDVDCLKHDSTDHTIPANLRGPVNASSTTEIKCWVPTWLNKNPRAILRLYAGKILIAKAYSKAQDTQFVGQPSLQIGDYSNLQGGAVPGV